LLAITVGAGDIAKQINAEASPHLEKVAKVGSSPAARASVSHGIKNSRKGKEAERGGAGWGGRNSKLKRILDLKKGFLGFRV
jgi:hypothetical protein